MLLRHLQAERDLRREIAGALGVGGRRGRHGSPPARPAPTRARARAASPARRRAGVRRAARAPRRLSTTRSATSACTTRDAEVRRDHDRACRAGPGCRVRLPNRRRAAGCSGRAGRNRCATSRQRAMSRTERDRQPLVAVSEPMKSSGPLRDPAVRALEPEQPGERGRDADGPAAVATGREGHQPPATAAAAPPDDPPGVRVEVPRVRGRAVELREREVDAAELARGREPDEHRTGSAQPLHQVESWCATRSRSTSDASVFGQPSTSVSSLTPTGTPPNGSEMIGFDAPPPARRRRRRTRRR